MNKTKTAAIVSIIACIVLASSLTGVVLNYEALIREKNAEIEQKEIENEHLMEGWIDEAKTAHTYWAELYGYQNPLNSSAPASFEAEKSSFLSQNQDLWETMYSHPDPQKLKTILFYLSKKPPGWSFGQVNNVTRIYELNREGFAPYNVAMIPELEGNTNFTAYLDFVKTNYTGIPIVVDCFEGGNESLPSPNVLWDVPKLQQIMQVANVTGFRFAEPISWYMDHPELDFPLETFTRILDFCRTNNLTAYWSEWKMSSDVWPKLNPILEEYQDVIVYMYQTNNGFNDPFVGYLYANNFTRWGASVQAWWWNTTGQGLMEDMPPGLMAIHARLARNMGAEVIQFEPSWYLFENGDQPKEAMKALWKVL